MKIYPSMNKTNTALLVIDPVNSCAHEKCETPQWNIHFTKIRQMLPKLDNFLNDYRQQIGGLVVITTIAPWKKKNLPDNINELYTDPSAYYYSDDETGFDEQFYIVKPQPSDIIFTKNTYDSFSDGHLDKVFIEKGIRYVIVTGIFTDGCVLASVVSGFSKGYNFVILKDLIETTDSPTRQQLQELLVTYTFPVMYGRTITSKDLLEESHLANTSESQTANTAT